MRYSIWLDVCSLFILLSLFLSYRIKKTVSIYRGSLLISTIGCITLCTITDLIALGLNDTPKQDLLYGLHSIKYLLMFSSLCFMLIYTSVVTNHRVHGRNVLKLLIVPIIFITSLLVINYRLNLIFSVSVGGRFEYGPYYFIFYILDFYYVAAATYILFKGKNAISQSHKIILPGIAVIITVGTALDYFFPSTASMQFTLTIFITLVFASMQNPDEFYSDDSLMMNKNAFNTLCNTRFTPHSHTQCVAINIHNIDLITSTLERTKILHAESVFLKSIKQFSKRLLMFKLDRGNYLIVMDENNKTESRLIYEESCKIMETFSNAVKLSFPIYSTSCAFSCPEDVTNIRMIEILFEALKLYENNDNILTIEPGKLNLQAAVDILRVEDLVKTALDDNRLEVYYQPIYNSEKKKFTSAEALIRMKDHKGNFIPPDVFIPIAEKSSLIIDVGKFVLKEVCKILSEEKLKDYGLEYIEVNMSMVECLQSNLATRVMTVLNEYKIQPEQINLEITETSSSGFTDIVDTNINILSKENICFSLDDFGTGYSSLARILSLPLKLIKIDKSIVQAPFISNEQKSAILLENFIKIAISTGAEIVAEGVETREMAKEIIGLGCKYIQGFYFSKPLQRADFVNIIKLNKPEEV